MVYTGLLAALAVATTGAVTARPVRVDVTGGLSVVDNPPGWYHAVKSPAVIVLVVLSLCFISPCFVSPSWAPFNTWAARRRSWLRRP